jgi:hypothetical protein
MVDAAAANEDSIADTQFLLLTINGDRQDTLEPIKDFVCIPMVVGRGHAGVRGHHELEHGGALVAHHETQLQLPDPYNIASIRFH